MKKVAVLGMGVSGLAATKWLLKRGATVFGIDRSPEKLKENPEIQQLPSSSFSLFSEREFSALKECQAVVLSPGVPLSHPLCKEAKQLNIPLIGEVELAMQEVKLPVLAVTGTNGKTTVTSCVEHVLLHVGKKATALGNIGTPLTQGLEKAEGIIVLELSSYQLELLKSAVIDAAVILNITPDHLDRYPSMQSYAKAKIGIENCLKTGGELYLFEPVWGSYQALFHMQPKRYGYSQGCAYFTDGRSLFFKGEKLFELPVLPSHDLENVIASYALCQTQGVEPKQFLQALETFQKPPHRMEFVREVAKVAYYNDSKGTNPEAVVRAVSSFCGQDVWLIAGGVDKGADFSYWKEQLGKHVKKLFLIGPAQKKIAEAVGSTFPLQKCQSLEEALESARREAMRGDIVLLSPGCASFDCFQNYEERGNCFKEIVNRLS